MPSSRPTSVPIVINLIRQLDPQSILDVGVGFGKWGHLFREYTDILASEEDPDRYRKENWQVKIDGVEGFPTYLTDTHRYIYDEMHVGDAAEIIPNGGRYDVIYFGDIIEHFDKDRGIMVINEALEKANKAVILSTPKFETYQKDLCDNDLERHRSLWAASDFLAFPNSQCTTAGTNLLIAAIRKPGMKPLKMTEGRPGYRPSAAKVALRNFRNKLFRYGK